MAKLIFLLVSEQLSCKLSTFSSFASFLTSAEGALGSWLTSILAVNLRLFSLIIPNSYHLFVDYMPDGLMQTLSNKYKNLSLRI
ncbi:hypothetical protein CXF78_20240 [Shewanella sp. 11B5]|nr:hypothetical protein CXF78_20240 [Shewanella sp. 11B5]